MADCCPACREISDKHHAVIQEIVYNSTDERERPRPRGRRLTQGEAWSRWYDARGEAADANASRMLSDANAKESLAHHRAQKLEASKMDRDEHEALTAVRARAKVADITHFGEPDPDAFTRALEVTFRGVEDRNSTESSEHELLPESGNPEKDTYMPAVVARIPTGRRKASEVQISKAWCAATQRYYMDPMDEWPQDLRDALIGWQETKTGRLLAVFSQDRNSSLLADVKGWKSITINESAAIALARRPLQRLLEILPAALEAVASGSAAAWVSEMAAQLPEKDFGVLVSGATGSVEEVGKVVVGWASGVVG